MRLKQSVSTLPYLIDQFLERQGLNGGEKSYNGGIFPVANTFSTFKALLELINCSLSMFWSLVIQVNTYHKIRNSVAYVYTNLRQNLRLNRKTVIAMMGTPQIKKRKICFRWHVFNNRILNKFHPAEVEHAKTDRLFFTLYIHMFGIRAYLHWISWQLTSYDNPGQTYFKMRKDHSDSNFESLVLT